MAKVEGVDYTPEGIEALRQDLIKMRNGTMNFWPERIDASVVLSRTIAIMAHFKEEAEKNG